MVHTDDIIPADGLSCNLCAQLLTFLEESEKARSSNGSIRSWPDIQSPAALDDSAESSTLMESEWTTIDCTPLTIAHTRVKRKHQSNLLNA
jgi:hypothetical protein